jgi:glycosyltransferase involved in cell wall biosynthesis
MACNLPVVATDVGDIRELVGTTEGCYVGPPDEAAFARQLAAILRRGARTTGRQQISHLTPEAVTQRIVRVYESVLADQRRGTQSAANMSV